jgi:hypothetical protein
MHGHIDCAKQDEKFDSKGDNPVNILFYIPVSREIRQKFEKEVVAAVPKAMRECCYTIEELSRNLRRKERFETIAVIMASREKDLLDIYLIRELLHGFRLILILPNNDKSTVAMGHCLCPRFMDTGAGSYSRVSAVLNKMTAHPKNRKEGGTYAGFQRKAEPILQC